MDIVIEHVPEDPPQQPQLQRENTTGRPDTLEEAQLDAALRVSAQGHAQAPEEAPGPTPKRRGRPPGSKNKPRIMEQVPEAPMVLNEPPEPAPKKPVGPRQPRAPKAQPAPPTPQAPVPHTPLQVAASMLEVLRDCSQTQISQMRWRLTDERERTVPLKDHGIYFSICLMEKPSV